MIEFRLLGSVDLKGPEGTLRSVLAQPKRVALLAYLAVARPTGFHRRDKLLGLFWLESDQEHGRAALRKAVYLLRQSLGEDVIVSRGDEEIGLAEGVVWCDTAAFEAALDAGEPEEALELYRGDLLDGFYIAEAPEFERWLDGERERLRGRASEAAWTLADEAEADDNGVEAAKWARKAVSFSPSDEAAFRRLLELLDRLGDRTGAIKEYEAFARRSQEEYEAEPSPETQALIAAIREREVAAAGGSPERSAEVQAGEAGVVAPWPVARAPARELEAEARPISLPRVLATYALVSLAVLVAVHIFTLQLGLPGWFFPSAVVVLLVCLPIIVATALVQGPAVSAKSGGGDARAPSVARRWLTWRTSIGVTIAALAVLGLAVTGFMAFRVTGIGPWGTLIAKGALEKRDVIVLADLNFVIAGHEYRTGNGPFDDDPTGDSTLALALTNLVRVELEQSPAVNVAGAVYLGRVLQQMERNPDAPLTSDLAREIAIREGLKAVVTGEIYMVGSSYVLSLGLVAAETGETLASFQETASDLDATIPAVNHMSRRLRERVGESLKSVRSSPPLSQARTASLEALRLQTEAAQANMRGDATRALDLLNRAIEIDTAFAEAYRLRSSVLGNLSTGRAQAIADATRAYELRHRLPLWERYWVEGQYHRKVGEWERAITAYGALLNLRPDFPDAWINLGIVYRDLREFARAEETFRRPIQMGSLGGVAWVPLAVCLFNQGKFDEAWETLRQWEAKTREAKLPDHRSLPVTRARFAFALGDYDGAEAHYRDYLATAPGSLRRRGMVSGRLAAIAGVQGRIREAERHEREAMRAYEQAGDMPSYLDQAVSLARLYDWVREMPDRALAEVDAALERYPFSEMAPLDRPYLNLARFYAEAGSPGRAKDLIAEYEVAVDITLRRRWEPTRHLALGEVALAESRPLDAIEETRSAIRRIWSAIRGLTTLARAYEMVGEPDSAIAVYERYITTPFYYRGDDYPRLPFVYGRLGALYQQRGDPAKAILYYGKFVDLWKDADPELQPRVEAARRAVEALSPGT